MATSISKLADELYMSVKHQKTPEAITDDDMEYFIIHAIERLYVDTGRATVYSDDMITESGETYFSEDLLIDEKHYVLYCAQIAFYMWVQNSVNTMVSYTTDALSITGGDKVYAHIADTIEQIENNRRILYYKMVRYVEPGV